MIDLKIRNATAKQWPVVADVARANLGIVERRGVRNGVVLQRDNVTVFLYLTLTGKTAVAYVDQAEGQQ